VIDLSREAARRLRMEHEGLAPVRIEQLSAAHRAMN
jgi:rare lipoprotein A (peptidoglycan hydrolase)